MTRLILVLGIVSNAAANVMMPSWRFPSIRNPVASLKNRLFWPGLGLYGAMFLLYAAALARLPLNVTHPILTAAAVAAVALWALLGFREPLRWTTAAGIVLIIAGVALVSVSVA